MRDFNRLSVNNNTLLRYRDLDYDMWYAISEFIDNSLHSYLANKTNLNELGINKCESTLLIDVDTEGNEYISIEDNAGGVHPNDFDRLLSIGVPKEKSEYQLSEFGMGMKTASIWLGNFIEIETKNYNCNEAYKITIDISAIGTEKGEVDIIKVLDSSLIPGYTKIKISQLNRRVKNKTNKVGVSLASIYKKYIESNDLKISFQGEELTPQVYTLEQTSDGSEIKNPDYKNRNTCDGAGLLLNVSNKTIWYYNDNLNDMEKVNIDGLYYSILDEDGTPALKINDKVVLKCLRLPLLSTLPSTTQPGDEPHAPYDTIKYMAVNDDVLFAVGCYETNQVIYYCKLTDGIPETNDASNWKTTQIGNVMVENIKDIFINDNYLFIISITNDNNYKPIYKIHYNKIEFYSNNILISDFNELSLLSS